MGADKGNPFDEFDARCGWAGVGTLRTGFPPRDQRQLTLESVKRHLKTIRQRSGEVRQRPRRPTAHPSLHTIAARLGLDKSVGSGPLGNAVDGLVAAMQLPFIQRP